MKSKLISWILSSVALLIFSTVEAQNTEGLTQTIRGTIIDTDTKMPAIGANVIVINSDPFLGASTDINGNFRIDNVPIGRVSLKITCLSFEDVLMPNMLVGSGKELVLQIELIESVTQLAEIEITGEERKNEVMNEMATVSARTFSVEETSRYAGSFNDPARMVAGFAGVTSNAEGNNDIVVRGNSPKGIQWRLEGIEIPNPNHFSDEGSTGGPINALNSDMLSNSDFYSGAFAPEFGNAYSGLFDIRLRQGNNQKREYSFQIGVLGTDFTVEGPFRKGGNASYLANYRYSSLALLDGAGIVDFNGVPKYQDASFKLHMPTKNAGVFSLFGLGGKSSILEKYYETEAEEKLTDSYDYRAEMAVVGLNHTYSLGEKAYLKTSISGSENGSGVYEEVLDENGSYYNDDEGRFTKMTSRAATTLNYKFNAKNKLRTGVIYSHHFYNMDLSYFDEDLGERRSDIDEQGDAGVFQGFASWQFRPSENLTFTSGVHYLQSSLNNQHSVEPRIGMKWRINPVNSITAGFGVHSKVESINNYFATSYRPDGTPYQPNIDLELQKARHYVVGFEHAFNTNLYLKAEAYYQELYNLPVEDDVTSSFSLVNSSDWYTHRELVNRGTGTNYGLELTLERFFSKGYFFMSTLSLYEATYTAMDGVEHNSRFNGNYVGNVLFGKEMPIGKASKNRTLAINARVSYIGGTRYSAIVIEASRAAGYSIRDHANAFSEKADDIFLPNLMISLRRERAKSTQTISIDIQNVNNNQARIANWYNPETDQIEHSTQLPLLPVISYRLSF